MEPSPAALAPLVGVWCVLAGAPLAVGLAAWLARRSPVARGAGLALGGLPLLLSPPELLPEAAPLAARVGAAVASGFPWLLGTAALAFARGRGHADVAATLGDRPLAAFVAVELPMLAPALLAGALLAGAHGALAFAGARPGLGVAAAGAAVVALGLLRLHRRGIRFHD